MCILLHTLVPIVWVAILGFSSASSVTLNQTECARALSITVCYTPGGWGFFGSFQDHQSRYSFALYGEAEAVEIAQGLAGLLLDWPESMDRKPKSTRRRVQVVEPGPKLKTIRSFPHRLSKGCGRPKILEYVMKPRSPACQVQGRLKQEGMWA